MFLPCYDVQHKRATRAVAMTVANGLAQGKTKRQIAAELRPLFEGSRSRAARAARTLGAYVGTERTVAAANSLGRNATLGFQVFSMGGPTARHDHALRSGTAYYYQPKPGQWSMTQCPHPPIDRGGPHEDEIGIRWWCRCFLSPIISKLPKAIAERDYFVDKANRLIPEPWHYSQWWRGATERQKEIAVGVRRLAVMRKKLGKEPDWEDFISDFDGRLLTIDEINREKDRDWVKRRAEIAKIIQQNRQEITQHLGWAS